ncbi:MAG: polyprenyl synthetase family protein, partial [Polyangiaceae bacterium]
LRQLVERVGKRLRGAFLAAAFEACEGEDPAAITPALVALELLQAYLLIHDDWMDQDDVRRGGPTVHAALRATFDGRDADVCAILAGDLAHALALESLCTCRVREKYVARASRELGRMLHAVTIGQMLDVRGSAERRRTDLRAAIDTVYDMKTGSYTVRGPLVLGATLAGASDARVADLEKIARPLGILFQLRDDLIGVFGDPSVTGKSDSTDLLRGKFTALVVEAADDSEVLGAIAELRRAHAAGAPESETRGIAENLRTRITVCGARARVEERMSLLHEEATQAIFAADLTPRGRELLVGAANVMGGRDR